MKLCTGTGEKFFEILALLNQDEEDAFLNQPTVKSPEGSGRCCKVRWWANWQANALAPRYLDAGGVYSISILLICFRNSESFGGTEGEDGAGAPSDCRRFDVTKL